MKKFFVLFVSVNVVILSGCGKSEEQSFANEAQPVQEAPAPVAVSTAAPPVTQPVATRCAITVFDRTKISIDEVWSAQSKLQDAALQTKLSETRLTYYPVCLGPEDDGDWIVDDILIDDTEKGRKVYLKGLISNDPARFSLAFIYLGKQLLPTTGSILVGRNEATIAETASYIYDIRCNLSVAQCDPGSVDSKYPRR